MTRLVILSRRAAVVALTGLLCAAAARPQTPCAGPEPSGSAARRPRIGLALGGGGARGASHIGVLKVLEELRIPIDCIAGTSMGSVVGGLYVVGYTPEALEKVIGTVDWTDLFIDTAPRSEIIFRQKQNDYFVPPGLRVGIKKGPSFALPAAFIAGRKLGFLLKTLTLPAAGTEDFDRLSIPFRAVGADARTGEAVALSKGSLPRAIRASMAIPLIFTPVEVDGRLLIDGGNAQNLPVETARAMGADVVIAVDVGSSGQIPKEPPTSMPAMLGRLIDLPLLTNTLASRKLADLVIIPDLEGFGTADFGKMPRIIPRGEAAARAVTDTLTRWSVSEEEYRAWQKEHRIPLPEGPPTIHEVVVDPIPGFDVRRITRVMVTKAGLPLDDRLLQEDMRRISGMALWQDIEFRIEESGGRNVLHINAIPKAWGPTYLQSGLDFEIDDDGGTNFDLSLLLDATELNSLGADWKTAFRVGTEIGVFSQFFQPVDYVGRFFVAPRVGWLQRPREIFFEEERLAEYRVQQAAVGLDAGIVLGHLLSFGQFSIGVERGWGDAERRTGVTQFPDFDFDTGGFVANLRIDQLDNLWFPHRGYFADLQFFASRTDLGADSSYEVGQLLAFGAHSFGRWTGTARVTYGDSFDSEVPIYGLFSLGGFRNLSGRPRNQLLGSTLAFGSLELRYRLTAAGGAIVKGIYLGTSAETGNVWNPNEDASLDDLLTGGSVYAVMETALGPLYIAWGYSNKKNQAFYLFLNRSF